jgi:hypothetical protein
MLFRSAVYVVMGLSAVLPFSAEAQVGFGNPFLGSSGPQTIGLSPPPPTAPPAPEVPAIAVDSVVLPGAPDGVVQSYTWPSPHVLVIGAMSVRLVEYRGGVLNGKASGDGFLVAGTAPPPPPTGGFSGYGNPFGQVGFSYEGRFEKGQPMGQGTTLSLITNQAMKGAHSGFFNISGPVVISVGDTPVVYATFVQNDVGDGPYRRLLYTGAGTGPTLEFNGSIKNGIPQGRWEKKDWQEQRGAVLSLSVNGVNTIAIVGEYEMKCETTLASPPPNPLLGYARNIPEALFARTDPTLNPLKSRCTHVSKDGYSMVFENDRALRRVTPISCKNGAGVPGKLTAEALTLVCTHGSARRVPAPPFWDSLWKTITLQN